jgi:acyl phosphate:glycerol-3-phosphate acyltransferase
MTEGLVWVAGGYVVGSFPSAYLVARAVRGSAVLSASRRDASEADAHMLLTRHAGMGWSAAAATLDVGKGLGYVLLAQRLGEIAPGWVAASGVAVVAGHCWPPYARAFAGRGLSAASGVLLALLPVEMAVAGVVIVAGIPPRLTGIASTLGLASVPVVAAVRSEPAEEVAMALVILLLVVLRRIEGMGAMVRSGIPWARALYYRAVWDMSVRPTFERGRMRPSSP